MKHNTHNLWRRCLYSFVFIASLLIIYFTPGIKSLLTKADLAIRDSVVELDTTYQRRDDFVFLGIDAASMEMTIADESSYQADEAKEAFTLMQSQWPWSRQIYAMAIERSINAGAKLVVIDLVLSKPSDKFSDGDNSLTSTIEKHRSKVVLASSFEPVDSLGTQYMIAEPLVDFLGPYDNETPFGYVNFHPDSDNIVRHAKLSTTLSQENQTSPFVGEPTWHSLASVAAKQLGKTQHQSGRMKLPKLRQGESFIDIYPANGINQLFEDESWNNKFQQGAILKDKIVIIGPASQLFQDRHYTTGGQVNGAQLHLHSLAATLSDGWLHDINTVDSTPWFLSLITAGALWVFTVNCMSTRLSVYLLATFVGIILWATAIYCCYSNSFLIGASPFLLTIFTGTTGSMLCIGREDMIRRKSLQTHLSRSMSPEIAAAIVKAPDGYYAAARGQRSPVTILFSDIRGFTAKSEVLPVEQLLNELNQYLETMVGVIFEQHGTVDKFIGDAIMATWGELGSMTPQQQVERALTAANGMLTALDKFNQGHDASPEQSIRIGIGIHHGDVLVGEIGSMQRADFTVIGDAVNLSSRLEALTSKLNLKLIVSEEIIRLSSSTHQSQFHYIGTFVVKGREAKVKLYTPVNHLTNFEEIASSLNTKDRQDILKIIAGRKEPLIHFYREYLQQNPEWDGIFHLTQK